MEIAESHELARRFVYSQELKLALSLTGDLTPIELPESYLKGAGRHARARIVAAGVRLGAVLVNGKATELEGDSPFVAPDPENLSYWLNLNGNVRHNSTCKWFENTKRGRSCSATEGRPCGICGG